MPPKSRKKIREKAKEKMLITSRLMAISLLVDDYIYKNKTISLLKAINFDEELTTLKLKCKQDARSLQVVEKLKIFMKSIIKQQSIDRLQSTSSGFVAEACVDNLPLPGSNVISGNIEISTTNNFKANTTTQLLSTNDSQNSEINKITQDIKEQKETSIDIISPIISVSNSEIKQVESDDVIIPNNSILNLNNKGKENITCISKNIDLDKDELLANATTEKEQIEQDLATPINLQGPTNQPEQFSIIEEKTCLTNETQIPNVITNTKNEEIQTDANKKIYNKNKTAKNIKTKTKKRIQNSNKDKENKSSGKNKSRTKIKEKTQTNLSWVENIKYVREVSADEHTNLQIEDNFWSNISLPGAWSSNDFD